MEQPARPDNDGRINPVAWIEDPKDDAPRGIVYNVPVGRLFFIPIEASTGRFCVEKSKRLLAPSSDFFAKPKEVVDLPPKALGPLGEKADPAAQRFLLTAYYGRQRAAKLLDNKLSPT